MRGLLPAVFGLGVFLGAVLLFSAQPMVARSVLPTLGGSPSVWTTCVLFFQAALLAGYAYAHTSATRLHLRRQAAVHLAVLLTAFLFLPMAGPPPGSLGVGSDGGLRPALGLLGWLVRTAGLPVFAVATTAPLLIRWFAATGHPWARDPYFLYASSNTGSLVALAAYPLWVERRLRLGAQSAAWTVGLAVLTGLVTVCASWAVLRAGRGDAGASGKEGLGERVSRHDWWTWAALAAVPSSLMLGLTTYLTTDLAAVPLLWVVPLGLYLFSYVVAFGRWSVAAGGAAGRALPLLVMVQAPVMAVGLVQPFWVPLHVLTFFAAAVVCHTELARRRPGPEGLTAYLLAGAVGGAAGGAFNALVAPVVFRGIAEYPLALVGACLALAFRGGVPARGRPGWRVLAVPAVVAVLAGALGADVGGLAGSWQGVPATMAAAGLSALAAVTHRREPVRFALTVGAVIWAGGQGGGVAGRVIFQERGFFGVLKVTEVDGGRVHRLFHGSTLHGQQDLSPERRREPLTYFDRTGPVGQIFEPPPTRAGGGPARVAVTGVGAGSLACYARPGESWTFYEIDPAVVRVARDPRFFTYLSDCRAARLGVVVGDARRSLAGAVDRGFDLIVLDAFSSDAVPVHLLDREALALYLGKLAPGGRIAVNLSNRYLDLVPVVARLADDAGLACRVRVDAGVSPAEKAAGKQGSIWAVLAGRDSELGLPAADPRWFRPVPRPDDPAWTDDYSNLIDHFRVRFWGRGGRGG